MRIAHVTDYYGVRALFQEHYLAKAQRELGHDVLVLTSDRPPKLFRQLEGCERYATGFSASEGVGLLRLRSLANIGGSTPIIPGLVGALRAFRPDVVHAHTVTYKVSSVLAGWAKPKLGYGLVVDSHDAYFNTDPAGSLAKRVLHGLHRRFAAPIALQAADHLSVIGAEELEFLVQEFGVQREAVEVIPLGVDTDLFRPDASARVAVRLQLGLAGDYVLIHTGKISPRKRLSDVVEAMALLGPSAQTTLHLLVVGHREDEDYCSSVESNARAEGVRLTWVPFADRSLLIRYFQAADAAVWAGDPSISILEAMASGLALIVPSPTNYPGVLDNDNGAGFPKGDTRALADAIAEMASSQAAGEGTPFGTRSRSLAVDRFSWSSIARRYLDIYARAAERAGRSHE